MRMLKQAYLSLESTTGDAWPNVKVGDQPTSTTDGNVLSLAAQFVSGKVDLDDITSESQELDATCEGLCDLVVALEQLNGPIPTDAKIFASMALESHFSRLGIQTPAWIVSQESADGSQAEVVSLEGLRSVVGVIDDHTQSLVAKVKQTLLNAIGSLSGMLPTMTHHWHGLQEQVNEAVGETKGSVQAKGIYNKLHLQGQWPSDITGHLREYALLVETLVHRFNDEALSALVNNAKLMADLDCTSVSRYDETFRKLADSWKDPRHSLPTNAFDFVVPGKGLFLVNREATYKGSDPSIKKLDTYATRDVPPEEASFLRGNKLPPKETLDALSMADIRALTKQYADLAASINLNSHQHQEASAHASVSAAFYMKRWSDTKDEFRRTVRDQHKALLAAYAMSYLFAENFMYYQLHYFTYVCTALQLYIVRSLKTIHAKEPEAPAQG
jgi:hypothetical protein